MFYAQGNVTSFCCKVLHWYEMQVKINWTATCDFQLLGILTSVDSDEPVHPPFNIELQMLFGQ